MKLSAMHNMLAAGATPLSGSELSTDDAIRLARSIASFCGLPQKSKRVCNSLPHKDFSSL